MLAAARMTWLSAPRGFQRRSRHAAVVCSALIVGAACPRPDTDPEASARGNGPTFRFAWPVEPRTLDPGLVTDTYGGFFAQNLFEGLTVWDAAASAVGPGIALRWDASPDGLVWTFHLRDDAIWSNGDPVTATDFVIAWRRLLNPSTGSDYASLLRSIRGAAELQSGQGVDASKLGVEALDRTTLIVTLSEPTPWFPAIVAHHATAPVPARAIKRFGHGWTRPGQIVVNGPFTLEAWEPGVRITLLRNPYFHDADKVALVRAIAEIEPDPSRVLERYELGELHWTGSTTALPTDRLPELALRPDAHAVSELGTAWLALQTRSAPFDDVRVRRALLAALDRGALTAALGPGDRATDRLVPPGIDGWEPQAAPPLADGPTLLAEAGFPGGAGFPPIELAVDDRGVHPRVAAAIADGWRRTLGIEVSIYAREYGAHADAMHRGEFQVARAGWIADYADPTSFLELFRAGNALNDTGWSDPGYDALLDEARRAPAAADRLRVLARAEPILLGDAPLVPLFHFGTLELRKPHVAGFADNPLQVHLLRYVSLGTAGGPGFVRGD